jgi:hypothetical protein
MEVATSTDRDPTSTSGIEGVEHCSYWPICAWLESKACSVNSKGFLALGFEGF